MSVNAPRTIYVIPMMAVLSYFTLFSTSMIAKLLSNSALVGIMIWIYSQYRGDDD